MNTRTQSIDRLARWGWPLLIVPLAMVASETGATIERALLGLALAAAIGGGASARHRLLLARSTLVLVGAATLALVLHLAGNAFGHRYAWLYSAPELPLYLKIANLWGGEEGTLLLMATLLALARLPPGRRRLVGARRAAAERHVHPRHADLGSVRRDACG